MADPLMEPLSESDMEAWAQVSGAGMANALRGLSKMLGQEIATGVVSTRRVPLMEATELLGGPEAATAAVYFALSGDAQGHMVLVYVPEVAFELVDMAMGDPPGTTKDLGEMERSVLGEVGNVMGGYFLQTLGDTSGMSLRMSPPAVMMDMAGAIIDAVIADIMVFSDEVVVVETEFGTDQRRVHGTFLVMPSPTLIRGLSKSRRAA
ncbi:MAG: chemotaxis protein CheX [Chloroflexi bacterium]|nr:chemotaxis protein CheX [Chloroflexota bacterium]